MLNSCSKETNKWKIYCLFPCLLALEKKINYKTVAKLLVKGFFFLWKLFIVLSKNKWTSLVRLVSADHFVLGQSNNIPFKDTLKEIISKNQSLFHTSYCIKLLNQKCMMCHPAKNQPHFLHTPLVKWLLIWL